MTREEAKEALDKLISKSRVHLYKPIQVAEILFHHRLHAIQALDKLEDYRNKSKRWRDEICKELLGRVCTSSARFQDNLFEPNAIPPEVLMILGQENIRTNGAVEAYIYQCFENKQSMVTGIMNYLLEVMPKSKALLLKKCLSTGMNEP